MREVFEIRVFADEADRHIPSGIGTRMGIARRFHVEPGSQLFHEIARIDRTLRAEQGHGFITSWRVRREYSPAEISSAEAFTVKPNRIFEPAGEECGTTYDETTACPSCGSGARQTRPLVLPVSRIPKRVDIAATIAGELVVSRRLVEAFERNSITGVTFDAVQTRSKGHTNSFQLGVSSQPVDIDQLTHVGWDPFEDTGDRCPRGDKPGPNVISEVFIRRPSSVSDVMQTRQFIGVRRGLLRPNPLLVVSSRVRRVIEEAGIKGWKFEIAHVV